MTKELKRIDPRGPRFGAAITAALALASFAATIGGDFWLGYILMSVMFALFFWSVFLPKLTHPYGWLFRRAIAPRLAPPKELEDPRPPQFAQKVGFGFSVLGMVSLVLEQSTVLLGTAAAFIFIAAFLNAAFGLCLGCQMYLILKRLGVIR